MKQYIIPLFLGCCLFAQYSFAQELVNAEYFYNADPGQGNGTPLSITSGGVVDQTVSIPFPSHLDNGFHWLFIRVQESNGVWSNALPSRFMIKEIITLESHNALIDAFEYFYNTDPGPGNGTIVTVTPTDELSINVVIPFDEAVGTGFHLLGIRTRDESGRWSPTTGSRFLRTDLKTVSPNTSGIRAYEYFFNEDPGQGNGTVVDISPTASFASTVSINIDESLAGGFHSVAIRTQDESGRWSQAMSQMFYLGEPVELEDYDEQLTAYEYFFGDDPGIGNGEPVPLSGSADELSTTLYIPIPENLENGLQRLSVRFKDTGGRWTESFSRLFHKVSPVILPDADIIAAEYFIDDDPGIGQATALNVSQGGLIETVFEIPTEGLSGENHVLYIRVKDESGFWSFVVSDVFSICQSSPEIEFSEKGVLLVCADEGEYLLELIGLSGEEDTYIWYKDGEIIAGADSSSLTITTSGVYYARAEFEDGCADETEELIVEWRETGTATLDADVSMPICFNSTTTLFSSYSLDGMPLSITWQKDGSPLAVTTDQLEVNESGIYTVFYDNGCQVSSAEILVEVLDEPIVSIEEVSALCFTEDPVQLQASISGGQWTGDVNSNGVFTPSVAGNFNAYYTLTDPNGCVAKDSLSIIVFDSFSISTEAVDTLTYGDEPIQLVGIPDGGSWSGSGVSSDGLFNPTQSGTGLINLNYSYEPEGCGGSTTKQIVVQKANQSIDFAFLGTRVYGDPNIELAATASSGLPAEFSTSNEDIAYIEDNILQIRGTGTVQITALQTGNNNYNPNQRSRQLTIDRPTLTISAENKLRRFREENPIFTINYDGFVGNEDESVLDSLPKTNTVAAIDSNVGEYPIVPSGAVAANYRLRYESGILTITKAEAGIVFLVLRQFYSGSPERAEFETVPSDLNTIAYYDGETTLPIEIGEYPLRVVINEQNYEGEAANMFFISEVLGIASADVQQAINIFPNPTTDLIRLDFDSVLGKKKIQLSDVSGRLINSFETEGQKFEINMSDQSQGMYLIVIKDENNMLLKMERIVKK